MNNFSFEKIVMNTIIHLKIVTDEDEIIVKPLAKNSLKHFDYVVDKFSRFDSDSELSRLNGNNDRYYKVSEELYSLIEKTEELYNLSSGAYDPTILDVLEKYGFDKNKDYSLVDNQEKLEQELSLILKNRKNFKHIKFNKKELKINLSGTRIDLGGIGKGYAIDLACDYLLKNNIENFVLNAGGDIRAHGMNESGNIWTAGLSIPKQPDSIFGKITLNNCSLASSGTWANKYKSFNHLIDTSSSRSLQKDIQTFVVSEKSIDTDSLATVLALMGQKGLELLQTKKIGGMIVQNDQAITNDYFPEFN